MPPGAFRYVFIVDGVRTIDPVNTRTAESNTATWSLFEVPADYKVEEGMGGNVMFNRKIEKAKE